MIWVAWVARADIAGKISTWNEFLTDKLIFFQASSQKASLSPHFSRAMDPMH